MDSEMSTSDADGMSVSLASCPGSVQQPHLTGRPPIQLYLSCDDDAFSPYQVLVRKNIELFEAGQQEVETSAQGRNKPIVLGQVGIRCRHCRHLPPKERSRGAFYYPSKLEGLYQAAQNLANGHFVPADLQTCKFVPADVVAELLFVKNDNKSSAGGGKSAWAERAHAIGVYEDDHGLRFAPSLASFAKEHTTL